MESFISPEYRYVDCEDRHKENLEFTVEDGLALVVGSHSVNGDENSTGRYAVLKFSHVDDLIIDRAQNFLQKKFRSDCLTTVYIIGNERYVDVAKRVVIFAQEHFNAMDYSAFFHPGGCRVSFSASFGKTVSLLIGEDVRSCSLEWPALYRYGEYAEEELVSYNTRTDALMGLFFYREDTASAALLPKANYPYRI